MNTVAQALGGHALIAGDALGRDASGAPVLMGAECRDCRARVFPPVAVCPECMSENIGRIELAREGRLYTWSVVHVGPKGWRVPYIAAYVDLAEGVRVFTHVVGADPKTLTMDMTVRLTTADLGVDEAGKVFASYAFTPAR